MQVTNQYPVSADFTTFFEFAVDNTLSLFPVRADTKSPMCAWKNGATTDPEQWREWIAAGHMLGISACASKIVLVEIDVKIGIPEAWQFACDWFRENLKVELSGYSPYCHSRSGGWHFAFACPEGFDPDQRRGWISIKHNGHEVISIRNRAYCLAPGSVFGGRPYVLGADPAVWEMPPALDAMLELPIIDGTANGRAGESDPKDVSGLVAFLDGHGQFDTEPEWWAALGAIKLALGDTEQGLVVAQQITHAGAEDAMMEKWNWHDAQEQPGKSYYRIGSLITCAQRLGWKGRVGKSAVAMFPGVAQSIVTSTTPGTSLFGGGGGPKLFNYSDDELALSVVDVHADNVRYVCERGQWLVWDNNHWRPDKRTSAYAMIRDHIRTFASGLLKPEAKKLMSGGTVASVEKMARTDQRIATEIDQWDRDPWLLATPGGTVDLRTGELRPARPEDHITKMTVVAPGGECPMWLTFLHRIMAGDAAMIAFLQRALGYSLCGITRDQVFFFGHGGGNNGKGVALNTFAKIVDDYVTRIPIEAFLASQFDRHPTDIAKMAGARMVIGDEIPEGRTWNDTLLKRATGGDPLTGRFMRQDFFDFDPVCKIWLVGNNKPSLRTINTAIRRRLRLIPFVVEIPERERDDKLTEKLQAEWPGILQWAIDGCLAWQRGGLQPPKAVTEASESYLSAEDTKAMWLAECCDTTDSNAWTQRDMLWTSWQMWTRRRGETTGARNDFYDALSQRAGIEPKGRNGVRGFSGMRLKPPTQEQQPGAATYPFDKGAA
jgi:putative DNA primase/helicase